MKDQHVNESQEKKILTCLKSGRSVTPMFALKKWGVFRLSARIFQIRKKHKVENIGETNGNKHYARYVYRGEK